MNILRPLTPPAPTPALPDPKRCVVPSTRRMWATSLRGVEIAVPAAAAGYGTAVPMHVFLAVDEFAQVPARGRPV